MVDSIVRVCIRLFMPRTSQSDPIRIAEVSYPGSAGIIDVTFCPGKKQRNGMSGHWERDKPICSRPLLARSPADRKSVVWGKSVSVCVDLGGRRIIKKKK